MRGQWPLIETCAHHIRQAEARILSDSARKHLSNRKGKRESKTGRRGCGLFDDLLFFFLGISCSHSGHSLQQMGVMRVIVKPVWGVRSGRGRGRRRRSGGRGRRRRICGANTRCGGMIRMAAAVTSQRGCSRPVRSNALQNQAKGAKAVRSSVPQRTRKQRNQPAAGQDVPERLLALASRWRDPTRGEQA